MPNDRINLTNQFLIAMPGMADPTFSGTVVYLCEHSEKGAIGLVINRPTDIDLQSLFERLDLKLEIDPLAHQPVFFGGPVQTERGFVLHEPVVGEDTTGAPPADDGKPQSVYASTITIPGGLEMTTAKDVLEAMATGAGPRKVLVTLGYSSWEQGQLESEIAENAWLTVGADPAVIFDTPVEQRYDKALSLLGLAAWTLSPEAGHA